MSSKLSELVLEMCPVYTDTKRLDDDAFLASLSLQESDGVACCMMRRGAILLKHLKKIVFRQPAHVCQWPLSKKVVATVYPLHFDAKSEQSDCNKSSDR